MELAHDPTHALAGLEQDLDLAEMEINSGRLKEARLRFANMSRLQRETPRALFLRARATESLDSRRMLVGFVKEAIAKFEDPASRAQLAGALALCGDRELAMKTLPPEHGLTPREYALRSAALEAMGTVPDLEQPPEPLLTAILGRRLVPERRR